jgi:plastocyanin
LYRYRRLSRVPLLVLGVGLSLIVAGCGSDDKKDSASSAPPRTAAPPAASKGSAQTIKVSADPGGALKFTKMTLHAKAGKVTLQMTNPSPLAHGIGIEGKGVDVDGKTVGSGGTSTATADLKPGTYEFYCTVASHHQAGMKGELIVK